MEQPYYPYYFGEFALHEINTDISLRLSKYNIPRPKFDDSDRLRAYFVILDLEKKLKNKTAWLLLFCASLWAVRDTGGPFAWTAEIFSRFAWANDTIVLCNLALLVAFWIGGFLLMDNETRQKKASWQASDEELGDLAKRIRELRHAQETVTALVQASGIYAAQKVRAH